MRHSISVNEALFIDRQQYIRNDSTFSCTFVVVAIADDVDDDDDDDDAAVCTQSIGMEEMIEGATKNREEKWFERRKDK